jgi:NlpC/P60 family putative phage cell wall peptidase
MKNLSTEVVAANSTRTVTNAEREHIVQLTRAWIGTPYHHQAALKGVGCDCFGLIRGVWAELYGAQPPEKAPPYTRDWAEATGEEQMLAAAKRWMVEQTFPAFSGHGTPVGMAGDVVIFRHTETSPAKHSAILAGGGRMIHAVEGHKVCEVYLGSWWHKRLAGVFSFVSPSLMVVES